MMGSATRAQAIVGTYKLSAPSQRRMSAEGATAARLPDLRGMSTELAMAHERAIKFWFRKFQLKKVPASNDWLEPTGLRWARKALKSDTQFNGADGLPAYIDSKPEQGVDAMSDQDEWTSYSQWGMFPTGTKFS
jgi:hypothetical protein